MRDDRNVVRPKLFRDIVDPSADLLDAPERRPVRVTVARIVGADDAIFPEREEA